MVGTTLKPTPTPRSKQWDSRKSYASGANSTGAVGWDLDVEGRGRCQRLRNLQGFILQLDESCWICELKICGTAAWIIDDWHIWAYLASKSWSYRIYGHFMVKLWAWARNLPSPFSHVRATPAQSATAVAMKVQEIIRWQIAFVVWACLTAVKYINRQVIGSRGGLTLHE